MKFPPSSKAGGAWIAVLISGWNTEDRAPLKYSATNNVLGYAGPSQSSGVSRLVVPFGKDPAPMTARSLKTTSFPPGQFKAPLTSGQSPKVEVHCESPGMHPEVSSTQK